MKRRYATRLPSEKRKIRNKNVVYRHTELIKILPTLQALKQISSEYGISQTTIYNILRGK